MRELQIKCGPIVACAMTTSEPRPGAFVIGLLAGANALGIYADNKCGLNEAIIVHDLHKAFAFN